MVFFFPFGAGEKDLVNKVFKVFEISRFFCQNNFFGAAGKKNDFSSRAELGPIRLVFSALKLVRKNSRWRPSSLEYNCSRGWTKKR